MIRRHAILALLLAATLAAAIWPWDDDEALDGTVVQPIKHHRDGTSPYPGQSTEQTVPATSPVERFDTTYSGNLFPAQSFRPPPKPEPPPPVLPPPPPMAPPLPFTFVGAWTENGRETVFLERGSQLLTVHVGEDLPGGWRLDALSPEAATFTYVSLNQQRTLRIAP